MMDDVLSFDFLCDIHWTDISSTSFLPIFQIANDHY